jgi:hypothetical protein
MIPYALQAEEACHDKSWAFPEVAFEAGLHYDWLSALFTKNRVPKEAQNSLRDAFLHGLATARRAYRISERLKRLTFGNYVFASALVLPIGEALMTAIYRKGEGAVSYATHLKDCEAFGPDAYLAREHFEKTNFEIRPAELTALFVQSFKLLAEAEPAIRYARAPWMLEGLGSDQKMLAMILWAATTFEQQGESSTSPLPSELARWMEYHRLDEDELRILK